MSAISRLFFVFFVAPFGFAIDTTSLADDPQEARAKLDAATKLDEIDAAYLELRAMELQLDLTDDYSNTSTLRRAEIILQARESRFGPDDPKVAEALGWIADIQEHQGRYQQAERVRQRVLDIYRKAGGPHSPTFRSYLRSLSRSASNLLKQSRFAEATELAERRLSLARAAFGAESKDAAGALGDLASLHAQVPSPSRSGDVTALLERARIIFRKRSPDSADSGVVSCSLGRAYQRAGFEQRARSAFAECLEIAQKVEAKDASLRGRISNVAHDGIARLDAAKGEWTRAAESWDQALRNVTTRWAAVHRIREEDSLLDWQSERAEREIEPYRGYVQGLVMALFHADQQSSRTQAARAFEAAQLVGNRSAARSLVAMTLRTAFDGGARAHQVRKAQDQHSAGDERADLSEIIRNMVELADAKLVLQRAGYEEFAKQALPTSLSIPAIQNLLNDDEALAFLSVGSNEPEALDSFVWLVTKLDSRWVRSSLKTKALTERVARLRCGLDRDGEWKWVKDKGRWLARKPACAALRPDGLKLSESLPFDLATAHELYNSLFGEVGDLIDGKHLLLVPSGALTSLPFQVLVTAPPAGNDLATAAWLVRDHALTVLPSVASLAALRRNAKSSAAPEAFIGFGDPVLTRKCGAVYIPDRCPQDEIQVAAAEDNDTTRATGSLEAVSEYFRAPDVAALKAGLCPLPDTAHELACVAKSLGAPQSSVVLGKNMTEHAVKTMPLDRYRIVHFATHGLLAGETAELAKINAEPSLVFSPPETASEDDDGLLTASEVAGLNLDADWVIMSACNTASGSEPGAETLSGLASAFFYAGARALLVSHWPVNSYAATMLTSSTFAEMRKRPDIGRSEAFRRAMLVLILDKGRPWTAHPSIWAPFVVVGEGAALR